MDNGSLFSIANLFYLVGTILLSKKVMKNRNTLNDFDVYGSITNAAGMMVTTYTLIGLESYVAAIVSVPTMLFWIMTSVYSFKNRRTKNGK